MGRKTIAYLLAGLVAVAVASLFGNPFSAASDAERASALQTLSAVAAATLAMQAASLAFFATRVPAGRLDRALARSNGSISSSLKVAATGSAMAALGSGVLIVARGEFPDTLAVFFVGVAGAALLFSITLAVEVLKALETDASDAADRRRAEDRDRLFSDRT